MALVLLAILLASCGAGTPEKKSVDEQRATLAARPNIEQITARYEEMLARMRQRLSAEVGPLKWVKRGESGRSGCGEFSGLYD